MHLLPHVYVRCTNVPSDVLVQETAVYLISQVTKFDAANPIANVSIAQVPKPAPGNGEVLVRITMRPCNPADIFSIMGKVILIPCM